MNNTSQKLWFRAKTYGYGWTPCSWQGWVATFLYVFAAVTFFDVIDKQSHSGSDAVMAFVLPFVSLTFLFIVVCIFKGEKPRWKWGNK